jgi:hypothetical protein
MRNQRGKIINTVSLIIAIIAFSLAMYNLFSPKSNVAYLTGSWFAGLFTLLTVVFTVSLYTAKTTTPLVLNLIFIITSSLIAVFSGFYWILVCMLLCLITIILLKATKIH